MPTDGQLCHHFLHVPLYECTDCCGRPLCHVQVSTVITVQSMHWYKSFICVQKLSECACSSRIAPPCTQVRYGVNIALNRCEKLSVAYNNVFRKITFLPRDCSASLMLATRDLLTCKMLIRKHAYIFMKSAAESRNVILYSIVRSDCLCVRACVDTYINNQQDSLLFIHLTFTFIFWLP